MNKRTLRQLMRICAVLTVYLLLAAFWLGEVSEPAANRALTHLVWMGALGMALLTACLGFEARRAPDDQAAQRVPARDDWVDR